MSLPAPCLTCGHVDKLVQGRCPDCKRAHEREKARGKRRERPNRPDRYGKTHTAFRRLSQAARRAQPWCLDCLRHESELQPHERLTLDHSPEAMAKQQRGEKISLADGLDVLCSTCNNKRGSAQEGSQRWHESQSKSDGV